MTAQQRTIMAGLMVGTDLNVFELSVIGNAIPRMASARGNFGLYNWVFTDYVLTSTVTLPLLGRLGDQYGH